MLQLIVSVFVRPMAYSVNGRLGDPDSADKEHDAGRKHTDTGCVYRDTMT